MKVRPEAAIALLAALVLQGGCAQLGVVSDASSVSGGAANRGWLVGGRRLPLRGEGFEVLPLWAARQTQWGTDELVDVITYVGRAVEQAHPGSRLAVGDLSMAGGGASPHHRSHQTGRDADLLFFSTRLDGKPLPSTQMQHFAANGVSVGKGAKRRFDPVRTWTVVRALLYAPGPGIARIFIYAPLRDQLLDHARAIGESEAVIDYAGLVMMQPVDSAPHDDHLHVRIFCPQSDATCVEPQVRTAIKKPAATAADVRLAERADDWLRVGDTR